MKRTIPFTKTITFRTMIAEITDIEVKHTLSLTKDNEIEGDILVDGTYKMTDASQIEEEFHYKLPFMIELDSKYDTKNIEIVISDFYFEIINEEDLKINVEIDINGLEEKELKQEIISSKISLDETNEIEELELSKKELVRDGNTEESIPIPMEINEITEKLEFGIENPLDKLAKEIEEDLKEEEVILKTNYSISSNSLENNNPKSTSVSSIFSSISSGEETFSTYHVYIVRESDTIESIMDKYKTTRDELQNYNDLNDIKVGSKLIIPCPINE